jgi:hypothetical protein
MVDISETHIQACWCMCICLFVRPSIHMEQRGAHWTDFHEIWYWRVFEYVSRNFKLLYNRRRQDCDSILFIF